VAGRHAHGGVRAPEPAGGLPRVLRVQAVLARQRAAGAAGGRTRGLASALSDGCKMGDVNSPSSTPRWSRYVAIGDSFSEGLWDPYPHADGTPVAAGTASDGVLRGWADRLADHLAERRGDAPFEYGNLAIRGRKLRQIIAEQVPRALAMEPDLVSLVGGGNDILRPQADVHGLSGALEQAVAEIRSTGADVLLGTGFRTGGALNWMQGRVGIYNANIWSIAQRHGAFVLDTWGLRGLMDWRMWSDDRIHLTDEGHRRVSNRSEERRVGK